MDDKITAVFVAFWFIFSFIPGAIYFADTGDAEKACVAFTWSLWILPFMLLKAATGIWKLFRGTLEI